MNKPSFTLDKIKFATDVATFEKAVELYERGKVSSVEEDIDVYHAIVRGTEEYHVSVEAKRYDYGSCTCYLGQHDELCKHMVALALYVAKSGKHLTSEDKKQVHTPLCSNKKGELSGEGIDTFKNTVSSAMKYIKPYNGPSRIWFAYQNSLEEGCNRLSAIISELPVSCQTGRLLVELLLKLDKKLAYGGIDDSNGAVGGFMEEVVNVLQDFIKVDSSCREAFTKLKDRHTCFGWEEPLIKTLDTIDS